jgi:hypothetical protein
MIAEDSEAGTFGGTYFIEASLMNNSLRLSGSIRNIQLPSKGSAGAYPGTSYMGDFPG